MDIKGVWKHPIGRRVLSALFATGLILLGSSVPALSAGSQDAPGEVQDTAGEVLDGPGEIQDTAEDVTFTIDQFMVRGNTLLPDSVVKATLHPFIGAGKTADDVERAQVTLEEKYHDSGYPAVLVNIPRQSIKEGVVRLEVIESKIAAVKIVGNKYFTAKNIMSKLRSLKSGKVLFLPDVQKDLARVNANADMSVVPALAQGAELGETDVKLAVEDRLPLHASLEINNRSSHNTEELRLNAIIRYDNLWQANHSISFQYQTAPESVDQVQVFAGSYVMPSPWNENQTAVFYIIHSDSKSAVGEGFQTVGEGDMYGFRYIMPLPSYEGYNHNVTLGFDYKDFQENLSIDDEEAVYTPVSYFPAIFSYSGSMRDDWGLTQVSAELNLSFRGLVSDRAEFETKRYRARGNYTYGAVGLERTVEICDELKLFAKVDGQISDQPLVDNEQYSAGGMENVRGYHESEALGDNAIHGTLELHLPDLAGYVVKDKGYEFKPYLFSDFARLWIEDPLPDQTDNFTLAGAGVGVRGRLTPYLEYELDWAYVLKATSRTDKGDQRVHFKVKTQM